MIQSLCAIIFFTGLCCGPGFASGCEAKKQEFKRLNEQIIIVKNAPEVARAYPEPAEPVTEKLHDLIDQQIIERLNADGYAQPASIVDQIRCIQSGVPGYTLGQGVWTNTPAAFIVAGGIAIAVAFDIFRGGTAVSDDRPYFEVFRKSGMHWEQVGSIGSYFTAHTFFVHPLDAAKPGQAWFVLWGKQIGEGNAPLRIALAAYDGNSLSELWGKELRDGPAVERITGDQVTMTGDDVNEKGRAEDYEDTYRVVPEGLELVARRITKTY